MKFHPSVRAAILLFPFLLQAQPIQPHPLPDASQLLGKLSATLASLSRATYHYRRELNYPSENYRHVLTGDVYLEFAQPGVIYQVHDANGFEIYNGSEILRAITATRAIQMTAVRSPAALDRASYLVNSWATLRRALPLILADSSIRKSVVAASPSAFEIEFRIPRAVLTSTGALSPITLDREIIYRLTVDRDTFLPTAVQQRNNQNQDGVLVEFSKINPSPAQRPEASWRYTSYPEYRLAATHSKPQLLPIGSPAPPWSVPQPASTRLTLLAFWISHCGYSIDAVPALNALQARFGSAGLTLLAINPHDSEDTIQAFRKNHGPQYPLLAHGQEVAGKYGVSGYPTIYLINAEGVIVYAGPMDARALTSQIAAQLQ